MGIFERKKKIIIEQTGRGEFSFQSFNKMTHAEILDALLGAICLILQHCVQHDKELAVVSKQIIIEEISKIDTGV